MKAFAEKGSYIALTLFKITVIVILKDTWKIVVKITSLNHHHESSQTKAE